MRKPFFAITYDRTEGKMKVTETRFHICIIGEKKEVQSDDIYMENIKCRGARKNQ